MHRPRNVDSKESLTRIVNLFEEITKKENVVFSLHPRTKNSLIKHDLLTSLEAVTGLKIIPPQNYFAFQKLIKYAVCVITDSGGIQEETTFQKIPCITLRENTERPITITKGTNRLMSFDNEAILKHLNTIVEKENRQGEVPGLWDGNATERILKKCIDFLR